MKKITLVIAALAACMIANAEIRVKPSEVTGTIKRMNAVNNGPSVARSDQTRGNFDEYKALDIPFARTHDASFSTVYGGPHTVDINQVFPDFNADVNDPASYDFTHTDMYMQMLLAAGTKPFYRLGQAIEHLPKKYGVMPPADFQKWAEICEHIIRHYNYGWADGFEMGIEYWEIWNEPDLDLQVWDTNPRCWGGPKELFFEFYETAAKHLDKCFPELKIGGPALAGNEQWADEFLAYMQAHGVDLDFFSWHIYSTKATSIAKKAFRIKDMLIKYGYGDVESILNEWNYVKGWQDEYVNSIRQINGMKGAAFTAATMQACQEAPVDMLMYYDFRIGTIFNGAFDLYTLKPVKGYYPFYAWKKMREAGTAVKAESDDDSFYVTAARDAQGDVKVMITRFSPDNDDTATKVFSIRVEGAPDGEVVGHLIDDAHDFTEVTLEIKDGVMQAMLDPDSVLFLEVGM